jgi:trimeric autotransporter adhesin
VAGVNVLAVSVHNAINTTVSDVSFNLSLEGIPGTGGGDVTAPSVPANLAVSAVTEATVSLMWDASSDDTAVTGYRVFRDGVEVATTVTPGFTDTGLSAATAYDYSVSAFDAAGNESAQSVSVEATTDVGGVVETDLVVVGAVWSYLDTGVAPAANWNTVGFDDSGWLSGAAELGSAEGDEATVMNRVAFSHRVHYLRRGFVVANPSAYEGLELALLVDDGAAVYLNGVELVRQNLPAGPLTNTTNAITNVWQRNLETAYTTYSVPASGLVAGVNVLAVSVHNAINTTVSDVSFNLSLEGIPGS